MRRSCTAALVVAAAVAVGGAAPAGAVWNGTTATSIAPWAVRVVATFSSGGTASCSGSIISRHFVLTAAHCLGPTMQISGNFPIGSSTVPATVAWSGGWTCSAGGVDLALLQTTVDLSALTPQPLPLEPTTAVETASVGQAATAFGWGDTADESLVTWRTVPGECGGQAPSSFVLSTAVQQTRDGAYTVDAPCPTDNITGQICFRKAPADLSRIGVGDSGSPWVVRYGGAWLQLGVTHATFDDKGSEIDATSVGATRASILAQTNGEILQPPSQTILRDRATGAAWLVGSDGFRRSIPTASDLSCFQTTAGDPVVDAALFDIDTVPELVGTQATCTAPAPAPAPAPPPDTSAPTPSSSSGGGGGSSGIPPDLHVDVVPSATTAPAAGGELDYTITVSSANVGGSSDVRLDLALPAGYRLTRTDRDRGPGCTGTPPTLTCDVGWINPSASTHVWIFGTVGQAGVQELKATVTSLLEPELNPADNTVDLKLSPAAAAPAATPSTAYEPPPQALRAPAVSGTARVGTLLRLAAPHWSTPPRAVAYRWQLCKRNRCTSIPGATARTLRVLRAYVGKSIRVIATASFASTSVSVDSARVTVHIKA